MPIEAAERQRGKPDRRKPILVLCTWSMWTDDLKAHIGDRYRLQIPTDTRMSDLDRLSQQSWRLVLMTSVDAVIDQSLPLEALQRWFAKPNTQPVVVLSPFPTPFEARDSIHAGAIWYSEKPWTPGEIDEVLNRGLRLAQKARRLGRVGSLRYQVSLPNHPA